MNVLKPEKKLAVLSALVEGCSIRATSRMTGVNKTTSLKVLGEVGERCQQELDQRLREPRCEAAKVPLARFFLHARSKIRVA